MLATTSQRDLVRPAGFEPVNFQLRRQLWLIQGCPTLAPTPVDLYCLLYEVPGQPSNETRRAAHIVRMRFSFSP